MKHTKHNHKHPPQKRKVHKEKFKKIYFVSIITFVVLLILFIIASPFLGKAIFTGSGGTVDLQLIDNKLHFGFFSTDTTRSLTGVYFELSAVTPDTFHLCTTNSDLTIINSLGWEFVYQECVNNVLRYGFSPGDPTRLTSAQLNDVLTITPTTAFPESFRLKLSAVDLWAGRNDLFPTETEYFFDYLTVQPAAPAAAPASAPSYSGGGGSSLSCKRDWTCDAWSQCKNNQQTRTCTDKNNCQKEKTVGGRTYPVTLSGPEMPETTKSCTSTTSQPSSLPVVEQKSLPTQAEKKPIVTQPKVTKAPNNYIYFLIGGILLVIIVIALILNKFFRHHKTTYNYDELKLWVLQERQAGTSDKDIQEILQQKTKWTKEEIDGLLKS